MDRKSTRESAVNETHCDFQFYHIKSAHYKYLSHSWLSQSLQNYPSTFYKTPIFTQVWRLRRNLIKHDRKSPYLFYSLTITCALHILQNEKKQTKEKKLLSTHKFLNCKTNRRCLL